MLNSSVSFAILYGGYFSIFFKRRESIVYVTDDDVVVHNLHGPSY